MSNEMSNDSKPVHKSILKVFNHSDSSDANAGQRIHVDMNSELSFDTKRRGKEKKQNMLAKTCEPN